MLIDHPLAGAGKEQTQGLDARSLFRERDGRVEPALQPLQVPVRAVVLHVGDPGAATRLSAAVARHLAPLAPDAGLWLQDPHKYHATLFHASSHEVPPFSDPPPPEAAAGCSTSLPTTTKTSSASSHSGRRLIEPWGQFLSINARLCHRRVAEVCEEASLAPICAGWCSSSNEGQTCFGGAQFPVEASSAEVAIEEVAVERAAAHLCPLEVVLERVVATPTGNILACWQVLSGSDPAAMRRHASSSSSSHSAPHLSILRSLFPDLLPSSAVFPLLDRWALKSSTVAI